MKNIFQNVFIILCALIAISNCTHAYEKQNDGILLELRKQKDTDAQILKIQVCTESIVRIIASPGKSFSARKSLMLDKDVWSEVPWSVKETDNQLELSTTKLTVKVNTQNGAVAFYNKKGKLLLSETKENGKVITSAEVLGEPVFNVQQLFDSPDDEAFYGLGAHQNALWNYKGHDVDLWQLNIIDVIPFLVSSKNYGVLWDNNSRTKFGDIREYQSISSLTLYGNDGSEGGLTAEYFKDTSFTSLFASRKENRIEHEFLDVNDSFPEGFQQNVAAVRWSGEIESNEAGLHKLRLYCSGYTKMWLDGKLICDSWRQNWLPWTYLPQLEMKPGKKYKITIEWIHTGGYIGLKYLTPDREFNKNRISLYSEVADQIDYYFIAGENLDCVIKGYRDITGKTPMMPKWAMGFWQCRERYQSQEQLLSVVKEFRKKQIPLDNIVQDWFYWKEDQWGSHEFDSTRFPDPEGMVKELHNDLHTKIMISVWPKFYVGTKHYDIFNKKGWLYTRNVEKKQKDWVGPGYMSTFYDPYNEEARKLYWSQINDKLYVKGFDAWWLDSVEPDMQSNLSREEIILRMGPTAIGSASRYLNTYSLMNCKGVYEGQRQSNPDTRVFILTRSAFAGQQRYSAATWSGDVAARWYDLNAQVSAGLNFALSGIPYWTTDIGGFAVEPRYEKPNENDLEEWRELQTRWFQFGTFNPLFRSHGQFPLREMFNVAPDDHPAFQTMLAYNKLRYRLMPYIYSLTGMVTQNDYTIMRALVMDFNGDSKVHNIGDQFMFGPSFMINPITGYKVRSRMVYLPKGTAWYDLKTGKYFDGGKSVTADAPYTDIPVYVKAGSIIPCGPEIQYSDEKPADPIRLFVYTGNDGSFTLYEDENVNYNYENGKFSTIPFTYNEKSRTLTIGNRRGEFPGMLVSRTFEIVWIGIGKPGGLDFGRKPDVVIKYEGTAKTIKLK